MEILEETLDFVSENEVYLIENAPCNLSAQLSNSIPYELLQLFFCYLPENTLGRCLQVCKLWSDIVIIQLWRKPSDRLIWRVLLKQALPFISNAGLVNLNNFVGSLSPGFEYKTLKTIQKYVIRNSPNCIKLGTLVRELKIDSMWLYGQPKDDRYRIFLAALGALCPNITHFQIDSRFTRHRDMLDDEVFNQFDLSNISSFITLSSAISDETLGNLAKSASTLKILSLGYCSNITESGLVNLLSKCQNISTVILDHIIISPAVLTSLSRLQNLSILQIYSNLCEMFSICDLDHDTSLNSAFSMHYCSSPMLFSNLRRFELRQPITGVILPGIPSSFLSSMLFLSQNTLTDLHLFGTFVDDDLIEKIGQNHTNLTTLVIGQCKLSVHAMMHLGSLKKIQSLELRAVCVTSYSSDEVLGDSFITMLATPSLKNLYIKLRGQAVKFTDTSVIILMRCEILEANCGSFVALKKLSLYSEFIGNDLQTESEFANDMTRRLISFILDKCPKLEHFECGLTKVSNIVEEVINTRKQGKDMSEIRRNWTKI
ncbi:hypothetical protein HK096_007669 [Nowakowskiella sp. JEL0078]|nr:hypothetical protein HK096_007669 [Nowakowskiella sp. JEL0078]